GKVDNFKTFYTGEHRVTRTTKTGKRNTTNDVIKVCVLPEHATRLGLNTWLTNLLSIPIARKQVGSRSFEPIQMFGVGGADIQGEINWFGRRLKHSLSLSRCPGAWGAWRSGRAPALRPGHHWTMDTPMWNRRTDTPTDPSCPTPSSGTSSDPTLELVADRQPKTSIRNSRRTKRPSPIEQGECHNFSIQLVHDLQPLARKVSTGSREVHSSRPRHGRRGGLTRGLCEGLKSEMHGNIPRLTTPDQAQPRKGYMLSTRNCGRIGLNLPTKGANLRSSLQEAYNTVHLATYTKNPANQAFSRTTKTVVSTGGAWDTLTSRLASVLLKIKKLILPEKNSLAVTPGGLQNRSEK
ncbi:hypothetical protein RRG08_063485, partial [Elysia crispata]